MDYSPPDSSVLGILQARNWSGLPFPSPGDLPDSGIEPGSPVLQADSLLSEPPGKYHDNGSFIRFKDLGLNSSLNLLLGCATGTP